MGGCPRQNNALLEPMVFAAQRTSLRGNPLQILRAFGVFRRGKRRDGLRMAKTLAVVLGAAPRIAGVICRDLLLCTNKLD
jgi:hypothetical protein